MDDRRPAFAKVTGARIAEARKAGGLSQETLGKALGRYLDRPWPKQVVSKVENGGRLVDAAELVALAAALALPVSWFLTPPTAQMVVMPSGREVLRDDLLEIVHGAPTDTEADLPRAREMARTERLALDALANRLRDVEEALAELRARNDGVMAYVGATFPDEVEQREQIDRTVREHLSREEGE